MTSKYALVSTAKSSFWAYTPRIRLPGVHPNITQKKFVDFFSKYISISYLSAFSY